MIRKIIIFLLLLLNKLLTIILCLLLIIIIFICTYAIYDSYQIYDSVKIDKFLSSAIDEETNEVDFEYLDNENIIGWINIFETGINYPILKSNDNKYYLNKDYNGKYSDAGSIFLDYRNNTFKDEYSIIYGHNLSYGGMFSDIKKYKNKEFFNNHLNGSLQIRDNKYDIEILFFAKINAYDIVYNLNDVKNDSKLVYDFIKVKSKYINKNSKYNNKLLMLSTCNDARSNNRLILLCSIKNSS